MNESQRILKAIGPDAMQALCREFGGTQIYVPKKVPQPERDECIVLSFSHALKDGSTCMNAYERCAEDTGLSVRRVQQIVAGR